MRQTTDVFIAGAVRTPIGRFGGALASLTAAEIGTVAARAALERAGLAPEAIEETVVGNARPAGVGPNPARQIAHAAAIPDSSPAYTVNMACGSGLRAMINGYQSIVMGDRDVVLVGGAESMSRVPYLLEHARWGHKMGHQQVTDAMFQDGFMCPLCSQLMGQTAETLADRYHIGREEQDVYAVETQQRCERARRAGRFLDEIVTVNITGSKGVTTLDQDEHPRDGVTLESLQKLPPVFRKNGTVHAGNSSGIVDGAAAMVLLSEDALRRLKVSPQARIVAYTVVGVDPTIMGIGPVPAVRALLAKTGVALGDIDLIELNEAFAAQVIACQRELTFDPSRLNVNGGAIALGHPIGATGARISVTLVHEMRRRNARRGLATLCISGGQGIAMLLERTQN